MFPSRLRLTVFSCVLVACVLSQANAQTAGTTGWRGDGSGRFERAQPPTKWSENSENILWNVDVGPGYSSPVFVGGNRGAKGRLFLLAEPSSVVCVDPTDGKLLWQATAGYAAVLNEAEVKRIVEIQAKFEAERRDVRKKYNELRKADPESPQLAVLKKKQKEVDDRRRAFDRKFPSEKRRGAGNAAATVTCDGKRIFALFGTGIVAAFDMTGKRLWAKHVGVPQQGYGHSASPVLADNKLIVHVEQLTARDPATGKQHWQAEVPAAFGTAVVVKIAGEDVIATPAGSLVLASDGRVLTEKQFRMARNSPIVHDGVLYAHESGKVKAFRLPKSLDAPFTLELLWQSTGARDSRIASAVYHDGLLYAGGRKGIIDVIDATTGKMAYRKRLDIGELFSSPTMAGGLIFIGGKSGKTLVLRPGRKYDEVAINLSGRHSSTPLFVGRRMYLRTDRLLYCIGE